MGVNIRHNIRDVERGLSDLARKQVPFATSVAINDTLAEVKANEEKELRKRLDRPTPFTLRAFGVKRSSKRRLVGSIFAKDIQADYLKYAEDGGTRQPKGRVIVVPVGQRRNRYGNMPKGAIKRALARPDTFATERGSHLPGGIYKRTGKGRTRGLRLLAAFEAVAKYRPRIRFHEVARKTADARMPEHFRRALVRALRTARR